MNNETCVINKELETILRTIAASKSGYSFRTANIPTCDNSEIRVQIKCPGGTILEIKTI